MRTPTFTCATCDGTIVGHPTFHVGLAFCCAGCAADGPCLCSYDQEARPEDRPAVSASSPQAVPVAAAAAPRSSTPSPRRSDSVPSAPAEAAPPEPVLAR